MTSDWLTSKREKMTLNHDLRQPSERGQGRSVFDSNENVKTDSLTHSSTHGNKKKAKWENGNEITKKKKEEK